MASGEITSSNEQLLVSILRQSYGKCASLHDLFIKRIAWSIMNYCILRWGGFGKKSLSCVGRNDEIIEGHLLVTDTAGDMH